MADVSKYPTFTTALNAADWMPSFKALNAQLDSVKRITDQFAKQGELMRSFTTTAAMTHYTPPMVPAIAYANVRLRPTKPAAFDITKISDEDALLMPGLATAECLRRGLLPPPGTN